MDEEHIEVLRMIQNGIVTAEEGEKLLDALSASAKADDGRKRVPSEDDVLPVTSNAPIAEMPGWARLIWAYALVGGFVVLALSGIITSQLVRGGERLGWLNCTLPLMVLGGLVVAVAWWSRSAPWIYVKVHDRYARFAFSLPLPFGLIAWLARLARPWIPEWDDIDIPIDEMILALADEVDDEESYLAVQVNEREGEEVTVYIG